MKEYQTINGTSYHEETPNDVILVLESARQSRARLHISLGDPETGKDWLEEFESYGYIGRSMGPVKVPLIVANRRSLGGGAILDHAIVRIRESAGGRVLYQHSKYYYGDVEIQQKATPVELPDGRVLSVEVRRDGQEQAAFENTVQARRYINRLGVRAKIVKSEINDGHK